MTQEEILEYNKRCAEFLKGMIYIRSFPESLFNHNYKIDTSSFEKPFSKELTVKINSFQSGDVVLGYMVLLSKLKFHSDWNWIMEVVEAIEKLNTFSTAIHSDLSDIYINDEHKMFIFKEHEIIIGENGKTKKQAVVEAINQFLIWYKKNKYDKESINKY
jgi:hypothetical protein